MNGNKIHSRVLNRFNNSTYEYEKEIYKPLSRLKNFRVNADYDKKLRNHNMEFIKKQTNIVLEKMSYLNKNPSHPNVINLRKFLGNLNVES